MNILGVRIAVAATLLVLSALSGIVLSALGRPLNTALSAIHKLIAVSSLILAVIVVVTLQKGVGLRVPALVLTVVTGMCLLSLFVTGAVLSFDRPVNAVLLAIHKAAPLLTVVFAALLLHIQLQRGV